MSENVLHFILLSVCLSMNSKYCSAVLQFEEQPQDARIKLGEDHTFSCIASGMQEQDRLTWLRDGIEVDTLIEYNSRLTIGYNKLTIGKLTTLFINDALKTDDGIYKCIIIPSRAEVNQKYSDEATLTILSLPSPAYPLCSVHDLDIAIGSVITFSCVSERVQPPVNLTITRGLIEITYGISFVERNDLKTLEMRWRARKEDNGAILTCHQTSPLAPETEHTCSVGPLNVQYKPEIQIQYTNPVIPERETILFCQTSSNPPITGYQWHLKPEFELNEYNVDETGQILKLFRPSLQQSGTNITCTATNELGRSSLTVKLIVANPNSVNEKGNANIRQLSENNDGGIRLSLDVVIIIAAGVVIIVVLVVLVPIYHYCLCSNVNTTTVDSLRNEVSQPEVYYEAREGVILRHTIQDRSLPRVPTTEVYGHWRHSTASQVPNDLESHSYTYIDTEND
ncbi:uncharacterized protein LOC117118378 [Anneissia japonica]|uniref:uncharacterized protein LOC117118378 n=1 Tax=Anneissia japonica TaxID=1529436 RepID=UPI0014256A11|nr:uncharacterized protein LOC117118378 [Anneissia japonica]